MLATLVAVVDPQGQVLYANAALEDALGMSRRSINGAHMQDCFTDAVLLDNALQGARGNEFAALRYDAFPAPPEPRTPAGACGGGHWLPAVVLFSRDSNPDLSAPRPIRDDQPVTILREPDLADLPADAVWTAVEALRSR